MTCYVIDIQNYIDRCPHARVAEQDYWCMREGCCLWAFASGRVHIMLQDKPHNQLCLFNSIHETRNSILSRIWIRRSWKLITHLYLAGKSRMRGSIPPLLYTNTWHMNYWSQGHSGLVMKTQFLLAFISASNDGLLTRTYS